jgi:predicted DNA-binding transcriptional regulator AlpA
VAHVATKTFPRPVTVLSDLGFTRLITDRELAVMINVPWPTVKAWRSRGGGPPYVTLGPRKIRYDVEEVASWLRRNRKSDEAAETARPREAASG